MHPCTLAIFGSIGIGVNLLSDSALEILTISTIAKRNRPDIIAIFILV
jgi:hypothetical protein